MEILYQIFVIHLWFYRYNIDTYTHYTQYLYAKLTSLQITTPIAIIVDAPDNFGIIKYYNTK